MDICPVSSSETRVEFLSFQVAQPFLVGWHRCDDVEGMRGSRCGWETT